MVPPLIVAGVAIAAVFRFVAPSVPVEEP